MAMFGAHNLNDTHEVERIMLRPKKIIIHEDWEPNTMRYDADISLLEFEKEKINFNSVYINPICIWDSIDYPISNDGIVVGWGRSEDTTKVHENTPKKTNISIQNFQECFFKDVDLMSKYGSPRTICGLGVDRSGPCFGDAGGGLFVKIDGIYYLEGIITFSPLRDAECDTSRYSLYTNIEKFTDWIKTATQGAFSTKGY